MSVTVSKYGNSPQGEEVDVYEICAGAYTARFLTYGATWISMLAPDRDGVVKDVLLGFDTLEDLIAGDYEGMTVGRYANRISGGFVCNGERIELDKNENKITCLHSAGEFSHTNWLGAVNGESSVVFTCKSPDGAHGFPGNVTVQVQFTLTAQGALRIEYQADSDADTPLNMTNHAYFNLAGGGTILAHEAQLLADCYIPVNAANIPSGEIRPVTGTAFDFTQPKPLGRDIRLDSEDEQIRNARGYDHNFCIRGWDGTLREAVVLRDPDSGRVMRVQTDLPGVQMYTGNWLDDIGRGGVPLQAYAGVAFETQYYPDSPNRPEFPDSVCRAGDTYRSTTVYQFSAE